MNYFRIFFKKYGDSVTTKTSAVIEFRAKKFSAAYIKAEKMGKRKKYRIVMIAEVLNSNNFPDKL